MNNWPRVRLGEHVDLVAGFAFKSSGFTNDHNHVPLVKGSNVQQGYIDWDAAPRWGGGPVKNSERFELVPDDVVLAMDRPWVKAGLKYAWIKSTDPRSYLVQRVARLRGINGLRTKFLRFLIGSQRFADYIQPIVTGVNVPHISGDQIRAYTFDLPPLDVQDKVADILCAYDDLIENNTRRIAILEEIAQAIYREWFVNFRFPGHERVDLVESELGPIPHGWEIVPIGKAVETVGGGTPSTKRDEYWEDGEIAWFCPSDLTAAGTIFITESGRRINRLGLEKSSAKLFPAYSVMMTSRATIGVTAISTTEACTNQGFITCIPNGRLSEYQIYFWIKENFERINTLASGATFKEINKTTFRALPISIADKAISNRFVEIITPFGKQIEILLRQSANLRKTRDLLLPKLISGEIDVSAWEKEELETVVA